jgi:hypothetical protein
MTAHFVIRPVVAFMLCSAVSFAQAPERQTAPSGEVQKQTAPAPQKAEAQPVSPQRVNQPINVKVEVTITDQRGTGAPVKKMITVVAGDGMNGRIRSSTDLAGLPTLPLNVDVLPIILTGGKIRVIVSLQYELPGPSDETQQPTTGRTLMKTTIQENLALILDDAKPIVAAQSADPISERQVTIELKATILK